MGSRAAPGNVTVQNARGSETAVGVRAGHSLGERAVSACPTPGITTAKS